MCRNHFTFWVGSWLAYLWHRVVVKWYDGLMIRFWPYGRWPREWRDLFTVCGVFGHGRIVRLYEKDNEDCDCGADHTYKGCARCHSAVDQVEGER
jgi:hypothetical protein